MYALADCNNFFVSCERVFNPSLNGLPVVVLSNNDGCAISRSNEAKALGIPMGCPAFKIKEYPGGDKVIMLSGRHVLYRDISNRIMRLIGEVALHIEVYSVDEAFFKLPYDDPERNHQLLAQLVKKIDKFVGVPVSIGFAPTRTLAKIASHIAKKDTGNHDRVKGLTGKKEISEALKRTAIDDVWGIGRRLSVKLLARDVHFADQFTRLPKSLVQRIGNINLVRTQLELLGHDCMSINSVDIVHKTIMNSRTFGHVISKKREIADAIVTFAQSCATQLRQEDAVAQQVMVYVRGDHFRKDLPYYTNSCTIRMPSHSASPMEISRYALSAFNSIYRDNFYYRKAGVMVSDIIPASHQQLDLFNGEKNVKHSKLMSAIDAINNRYGTKKVMLAPTISKGEWAPQHRHMGQASKTLRFYSGMSPLSSVERTVVKLTDSDESHSDDNQIDNQD